MTRTRLFLAPNEKKKRKKKRKRKQIFTKHGRKRVRSKEIRRNELL